MNITKLLPIPLVALALVATTASAHDGGGKSFQLSGKVLGPPAQIDLGAPGPSVGDQQVITMDVFNGPKRVGESHVLCSVVRFDPATKASIAECENVTSLPTGQITASGVVTSDEEEQKPFIQAITGGTGAYRNVHGQLTVSEAGPQPATLSFQLS
jgi:Allene oxide cyclase barrel like domain